MGVDTGIEWTDATWNPVRGCSRVSEGCRNCYAEAAAHRFSGAGQPYEGLAHRVNGHASWTGEVRFIEKHLLDPLRWKGKPIYDAAGERVGYGPMRIFVNSMSDLFHENVTDEMRAKIFAVMALCPQHTFQILTKRPEVMRQYIDSIGNAARDDKWFLQGAVDGLVDNCAVLEDHPWPLPNVWLGVSCENQATADERIPLLLQTPAAVRFISAEPLLGDISLEELPSFSGIGRHLDSLSNAGVDPGAEIPSKLDWVIVGGESGPGARPMHPDWARSLRDQCVGAGVPFFFKQWGHWGRHSTPPDHWISKARNAVNWHEWPDGTWSHEWGKKLAGALLDGREWREFPA